MASFDIDEAAAVNRCSFWRGENGNKTLTWSVIPDDISVWH